MFELKVITRFAAAHQLKMVAQKCENLHGHNWRLEVCVKGERLTEAGILMDFGEIKRHVAEIVQGLDHTFLNELECFPGGNPSSESIAMFVAEALGKKLSGAPVFVSRVSAWESDDACATYLPPEPSPSR